MCDYSLCGIPTRLATEGEELVVHKFSTGSMGLASPAEIPEPVAETISRKSFWQSVKSFFEPCQEPTAVPAICIPPGARLILKDIPFNLQRQCDVAPEEGVVFTQISSDVNTYRDAVRFGNGWRVRLQDLPEGLRIEVLSLAGTTEHTLAMATREGHFAET